MNSINSFQKGINQDLQKSIPQTDSYFSTTDFRLITNDGGTSFALENIKGNSLFQVIPSTSDVWEITMDEITIAEFPINMLTYTLTINGNSINYNPVITQTYTEYLEAWVDVINANSATLEVNAILSDTDRKIIIWSDTLVNANMTISVVDGTSTYNPFVCTKLVDYIESPKIIGWEVIRDMIYIFTCNDDYAFPTTSSGQVWEIEYDWNTLTIANITLLYNNVLNFSTFNGIANPGMIEGRYENPYVQKLYWTDNYNSPRHMNVADPDLFGVSVSNIDIKGKANMSVPILQEVLQSGTVLTGVHQVAYRYKNTFGTETIFSPASVQTHVIQQSEQENDLNEYYGCDSILNSGKSLKFSISELDTSYDRIEIVDIYYSSKNSPPEINIIYDLPIEDQNSISFIITGNETPVPITNIEYNTFELDFTRVGSLAAKDNTLYYADVTAAVFDVDFDARAYRFPLTAINTGSTLTTIEDSSGNTTTVDSSDWTIDGVNPVPEDADAIQDYDSQSPSSWANFLYQAGSTVLGGSGPNISYKFTEPDSGTYPESVMYLDGTIKSIYSKVPHRSLAKDTTTVDLNVPNQTHPHIYTFRSPASPYLSFLEKGYTRDEMYRFGIVFYDLNGKPGYVKWIADIRMPHMYMPKVSTASNKELQFNHTDFVSPNLYGYNLGIEFTVDVTSVAEQISGFSIVRVERTETDKHIIGSGEVFPVNVNGSGESYLVYDGVVASALTYGNTLCTLQCPDFLFNGFPGYKTNDYLEIIALLGATQNLPIWDDGTYSTNAQLVKNYEFVDTPFTVPYPIYDAASANPYLITNAAMIENWNLASSSFVFQSLTCWNKNETNNDAAGGKTLLIYIGTGQFGPPSNYMTSDGINGTTRAYLANYKREVTNQYGGNSFNARSLNTYIQCANFVPTTALTTTETFTVFGGDTYITVFDNAKRMKNTTVSPIGKEHTTRFFPVETGVNIDIRNSTDGTPVFVPNRNDLTPTITHEDFGYNTVFSTENKIKYYFPKPDPYVDINDFDCHIYNSQTKINGELKDSWLSVKSTDFKQADSKYGRITSLQTIGNNLLFFQPKAVGSASVNERITISSTTNASVGLGTGGPLERLDYIDLSSGSSHRFGFTKNKAQVFFFDIRDKQLKAFSGDTQQLSITKGLSAYFNKNLTSNMYSDTPYQTKGITATYDNRFKEAIFTFLDKYTDDNGNDIDNSFTIAYNSIADAFSTFYSFTPSAYINDGYSLITPDYTLTSLYTHNNNDYGVFYDTDPVPSKLTIIVNPNQLIKVLDNLQWYSQVFSTSNVNIYDDTFTNIRIRTDRQNTDWQEVSSLAKHKENMWHLAVPKDRVLNTTLNSDIFTDLSATRIMHGKRMRDSWFYVDFEYTNENNRLFIIHYIESILRQSIR